MSVARHHADWLSLLEISGPFVSMPVLMRVFPQGLDPRDPEQARQLRLVYEEWQGNPSGPGKQRGWINHVLTRLLNFPADLIAEGQSLPAGLSAAMPEYGETLRPDLALVSPKGIEAAGKPQLLVSIYPPGQSLDRPVAGKHWKATPATRMMELLHASDIRLGLVTNGEQWMLVYAPRGETTGFTSWYGTLWIEEPITLRAFHSLLSINRFFGVAASETLSALLNESAQDQQEVTNQLGDQVRDAVEVLIQAFDRLDHESGRTLLKGSDEKALYDAALTVMMRLVFLFSAEERGLLHLGRPIYDNNYAVSTLREQLQEVADRYGEEVLERRFDAWARLLSSFRAVHGGVQHQDLLMPAYGGSLFDPNRYPFLEGRAPQTDWRITTAEPLAINNRVVLHLLKSLQMLQVRVAGGGPAEARRISFRALDIEQIGHIYEGLLDHNAFRAQSTVLGLVGTRKNPNPNITLDDLEELAEQSEAKILEELKELTGRSIPALKKGWAINTNDENHKVLVACGQDEKLSKRVAQFAGLLRENSFERPVVVLKGGIYASEGTTRRSTGTHYTPRSLTEPIVQHTLRPLVYRGTAEGLPKEQWSLKSPKEILDLKICDMTMGSGAFLVQVCRYLSERLVEAWENLERVHPGELLITPEGLFSKGQPVERLIPQDPAERLAISRRLVADRCLFGVDINPMAVEMAKLSIWLTTVDRNRPFTFLDHALKCGDSLLGIYGFKQLQKFSLDDKRETQAIILSNYDELIRSAISKRRELESLPSNDASQIASKETLNSESEELLSRLKLASDLLVAAAITGGNEREKELIRVGVHLKATELFSQPREEFVKFAHERLDGWKPFHWPLEFPEVFDRSGFDAIVGNPPFLWGSRISTTFGDEYLAWLLLSHPGSLGTADLCGYFLRRAYQIVRPAGFMGFIATNSIKQTDSRISCLDYLIETGASIVRAYPDMAWPGGAALQIAIVLFCKGDYGGEHFLKDTPVECISSFLDSSRHDTKPQFLRSRAGIAFKGVDTGGLGFVVTEDEEEQIRSGEPESLERIWMFLNGQEFLSHPQQRGSRRIINFSGLSEQQARAYPSLIKKVEDRVLPHRQTVKRDENKNKWWLYNWPRPVLYRKISTMRQVLVNCVVSKFICFEFMEPGIVFSNALNVFALDSFSAFAVLQSTLHEQWARYYGSTLETRNRYNPTDCFETFPWVDSIEGLEGAGANYHKHRREIMSLRQEGLTDTYNRFHNPVEISPDIGQLRAFHVEMDCAVATAYGWKDLDLSHDFHETKEGMRFTLSESVRPIILDRFLYLNHERRERELRVEFEDEKAVRGSNRARKGKNISKGLSVSGVALFSEDSE